MQPLLLHVHCMISLKTRYAHNLMFSVSLRRRSALYFIIVTLVHDFFSDLFKQVSSAILQKKMNLIKEMLRHNLIIINTYVSFFYTSLCTYFVHM